MEAAFDLWRLAADIRSDQIETLLPWMVHWHAMRHGESWWFEDATDSDTGSTMAAHDDVTDSTPKSHTSS